MISLASGSGESDLSIPPFSMAYHHELAALLYAGLGFTVNGRNKQIIFSTRLQPSGIIYIYQ
jgi:hypothetical protein